MKTEGRQRQEDHFIQVSRPHICYLVSLRSATSQVTHILCQRSASSHSSKTGARAYLHSKHRSSPETSRPMLPGSSVARVLCSLLLPVLCFQPSYTGIIKYNPHLQEICKNCLCLGTKIHKTESSGSSLLQQAIHAQASRNNTGKPFPPVILPTGHFWVESRAGCMKLGPSTPSSDRARSGAEEVKDPYSGPWST